MKIVLLSYLILVQTMMKIFDSLKENEVLRESDGKTIPFLNDCKLDSRLLVLLWSQLLGG